MRRGEIRWYEFSYPDKRRPILILTRDSIIMLLEEITIAPITSTIRNIPSEVVLTKSDGMIRECAINLDHLQTISKNKIGALIITLTQLKMSEVRSALLFSLGFKC
jgi:mRNA interferase MazF